MTVAAGRDSSSYTHIGQMKPPRPMEDPADTAAVILSGKKDFKNECHTLQRCQMPYGHGEPVQGNHDPNPGGYLNMLVMSKSQSLKCYRVPLKLYLWSSSLLRSSSSFRSSCFSTPSPADIHYTSHLFPE
ncbi:hypothetical protein V8E54_008733 [Elaphomyces granulatus]